MKAPRGPRTRLEKRKMKDDMDEISKELWDEIVRDGANEYRQAQLDAMKEDNK